MMRSTAAALVALNTLAWFAAAQTWPRTTLTVALLGLAGIGVFVWRRLDRMVDDYVKRYDRRRPPSPEPLPCPRGHD